MGTNRAYRADPQSVYPQVRTVPGWVMRGRTRTRRTPRGAGGGRTAWNPTPARRTWWSGCSRSGIPRVHAELRRRGQRHSRKRVTRLTRRAGIAGRAPKRWRKTTIPGSAQAHASRGSVRNSQLTRRLSTVGNA